MADWVVVVDDDLTNLKMAGHILSKHNKRVTALRSGWALLDYIRGNVPDIILMDIKMPEIDGFETLKKLRELEKELKIDEIPVIFLTADDNPDSENRGFDMGVSDYIRKPFDPDVLVRRIDNILSNQEKLLHRAELILCHRQSVRQAPSCKSRFRSILWDLLRGKNKNQDNRNS